MPPLTSYSTLVAWVFRHMQSRFFGSPHPALLRPAFRLAHTPTRNDPGPGPVSADDGSVPGL